MREKQFMAIAGTLYAMLAVVFGAFGAHGLKTIVTAERLAVWHTAVEYQMYHALALVVLSQMAASTASKALAYSRRSILAGMSIFSGSLYFLVIADMPMLGIITPIGGVLMIVGWLLLLTHLLQQTGQANQE